MHGGASPQVQAKARERLELLQNLGVDVVERAMRLGLEGQAKEVAVGVKAAVVMFDRTGMGASSTVNVEGSLGERLAELDRAGAVDSD